MIRPKVMVVFGTRPEAIKMAPVIWELKKHSEIKTIVAVTAQHRPMLDQMLRLFDIKPDHDLDLMIENQTLVDLTQRIPRALDRLFCQEKPDLILVQGDTTTTLLTGLIAFYHRIEIGHVEAGLRTDNKYYPFPEEINRCLTSHLADLHFASTKRAKENLLKEGINSNKIFITGNPVIDVLLAMIDKSYSLDLNFNFEKEKVILLTTHRRENWGKPLENICLAIKEIVKKNRDVVVAYPVHPNPNVRKLVCQILEKQERIRLTKPLDYKTFVNLMDRSYLILTDSGGIQEEAPSLGKPVLVLREVTERPEAVKAGTAKVVGHDIERIIMETNNLLQNENEYQRMTRVKNPYGEGKASKKIVRILLKHFSLK